MKVRLKVLVQLFLFGFQLFATLWPKLEKLSPLFHHHVWGLFPSSLWSFPWFLGSNARHLSSFNSLCNKIPGFPWYSCSAKLSLECFALQVKNSCRVLSSSSVSLSPFAKKLLYYRPAFFPTATSMYYSGAFGLLSAETATLRFQRWFLQKLQ